MATRTGRALWPYADRPGLCIMDLRHSSAVTSSRGPSAGGVTMSCRRLLRTAAVQAAVWALLAGAALAVAPEVRDQGKFFSPEALKKADEQIREIYRKYGQDVLVETFNTVPGED